MIWDGVVILYHKTLFVHIIIYIHVKEIEAKDELGKETLIYETIENLCSRLLGRMSE